MIERTNNNNIRKIIHKDILYNSGEGLNTERIKNNLNKKKINAVKSSLYIKKQKNCLNNNCLTNYNILKRNNLHKKITSITINNNNNIGFNSNNINNFIDNSKNIPKTAREKNLSNIISNTMNNYSNLYNHKTNNNKNSSNNLSYIKRIVKVIDDDKKRVLSDSHKNKSKINIKNNINKKIRCSNKSNNIININKQNIEMKKNKNISRKSSIRSKKKNSLIYNNNNNNNSNFIVTTSNINKRKNNNNNYSNLYKNPVKRIKNTNPQSPCIKFKKLFLNFLLFNLYNIFKFI